MRRWVAKLGASGGVWRSGGLLLSFFEGGLGWSGMVEIRREEEADRSVWSMLGWLHVTEEMGSQGRNGQ